MIKRTSILFAIAIIIFTSISCRELFLKLRGVTDEEKAIIQYFIDNTDKLKDGTYDKTKTTSQFYDFISDYKVFYLEKLSKGKFIYKTDRIAVFDGGTYFHIITLKDVDLEYFVKFQFKYDNKKEKWLLNFISVYDIYDLYFNRKTKSK